MHCGEMDSKFLSLAEKLGLHPFILSYLSSHSSSLPKQVPLGRMHGIGGTFCYLNVVRCQLYVLWTADETQLTSQSCLETRLAYINFSSFVYNYQYFTKIGASWTIARYPAYLVLFVCCNLPSVCIMYRYISVYSVLDSNLVVFIFFLPLYFTLISSCVNTPVSA